MLVVQPEKRAQRFHFLFMPRNAEAGKILGDNFRCGVAQRGNCQYGNRDLILDLAKRTLEHRGKMMAPSVADKRRISAKYKMPPQQTPQCKSYGNFLAEFSAIAMMRISRKRLNAGDEIRDFLDLSC